MKKIDKYRNLEKSDDYGDELEFMIWKAELNKELFTFWKKMIK